MPQDVASARLLHNPMQFYLLKQIRRRALDWELPLPKGDGEKTGETPRNACLGLNPSVSSLLAAWRSAGITELGLDIHAALGDIPQSPTQNRRAQTDRWIASRLSAGSQTIRQFSNP